MGDEDNRSSEGKTGKRGTTAADAREFDRNGHVIANADTIPFEEISHDEQQARIARARRDPAVKKYFASLRNGIDIENSIFEWIDHRSSVPFATGYWNGIEIICSRPNWLQYHLREDVSVFVFNAVCHLHPSYHYFGSYIPEDAFARFNPEYLRYLQRRMPSYTWILRRDRTPEDEALFPREWAT